MAEDSDSNELIQKAETRNQKLEIGKENEDADLGAVERRLPELWIGEAR